MGLTKPADIERARRAAERAASVAATLGGSLMELADFMHLEMAEAIPELRGDVAILELLKASVQSNVETFLHFAQHSIAIEDIAPPAAAVAYAQRLAQHEVSSNALLKAYRVGQRRVVDLAFEEIAREETDPQVAYLAAHRMHELTFTYIEKVTEAVLREYEYERERWLANRNTVRTTMLATLLSNNPVDVGTAENALGYRLRQNHLGVIAWDVGRENSTAALHELEALVAKMGAAIGGVGQPLFVPRDHSLGWAWIPLGRATQAIDLATVEGIMQQHSDTLRVTLGTVRAALPGFRATHVEALRAQAVSTLAGDRAHRVISYADPGVRAAALLTGDMASTRALVAESLGPLGADDEGAERLRETLAVFLAEGGSYLSTSERIHVHKNTVKYRIDKAIEMRGQGLDHERLNMELALIACQWLGRSVLSN